MKTETRFGYEQPWFEKQVSYEVLKDVSLSKELKGRCAHSFNPGEKVLFDQLLDNTYDGIIIYVFKVWDRCGNPLEGKHIGVFYDWALPDWSQYFRKVRSHSSDGQLDNH